MKRDTFIRIIPYLIAFLLFVAPFFWLRRGEMDLGGDSGRLYFYEPLQYLTTHILYNVIPSGMGGDTLSYFALPYVILLVVFRLFVSPTVLIALSNGLKLSVAFLSCYLIARELLSNDTKKYSLLLIEISSVIAGLFYIFSPIIVNSGWDRAIITHTQIFVYPFVFYLLLKHLITSKKIYLISILFIAFIFSINFSFYSAPGFFAFFPLSVLYLWIYIVKIRKIHFPYKTIFVSTVVLFLTQVFHIIPHIVGLFITSQYSEVFSQETIISRGLDYFLAIAPGVKVSYGILNLAQFREITILTFGSFIIPFIVVWNLWKYKRQEKHPVLYLTLFLFFVTLFFETANITNIGFTIYKYLFYVPGFKMFRNFFGQWSVVFVFYYSLLIGLSLPGVLVSVRRVFQIGIVTIISIYLISTAYPLLNGSMVNSTHFQTKKIKQNISMDPAFEQILQKIRFLPVDGKIITFPLAGPGYQIFSGSNGGVYVGPSLFSYLSGKNDYTSFDGMGQYGQLFLDAVRSGKFEIIRRIFKILNIQYLFYNSDPYIYEQNFPNFPYDYVTKYLPKTQKGYSDLIQKFPINLSSKIDLGGPYALYPIDENNYLPHIFTGNRILYTNASDELMISGQIDTDLKSVFISINDYDNTTHEVVLEAQPINPFKEIRNNIHLHKHAPYVSVSPGNFGYPIAVLKEKIDLLRASRNHARFFDLSFLLLAKRIVELDRWGNDLPIIGSSVTAPSLWRLYKPKRYYSWEASLARYENEAEKIIQWIFDSNHNDTDLEIDKIKAKEQFDQNRQKLLYILRRSFKTPEEISYLKNSAESIFERIYKKLDAKIYDINLSSYVLSVPLATIGIYDAVAQYNDSTPGSRLPYELGIADKRWTSNVVEKNTSAGIFKDITINKNGNNNVWFRSKPKILFSSENWINSGSASTAVQSDILSLTNISNDYTNGLIKEIGNWEPNKQYIITFDYDTHGDYFLFRFFDKQVMDTVGQQTRINVAFEKNLYSHSWKTHQSIVSSNEFSRSAYFQFLIESNNTTSNIDIKNLSVVQIDTPVIFFRKQTNNTVSEFSHPNITFHKINSTKYQIEVSNAEKPYVLVFLEAFAKNWQLIDVSRDNNAVNSNIMGILGRIFQKISSFFQRENANNAPDTSCWKDNVCEGEHTLSFTDPRIFSSWGKTMLKSTSHKRAYRNMNAWIVRPEDMNNKSTYTLILENSSQNYFYIYLLISLSTIAGLVIYTIIFIYRHILKRGN